MVALALNGVEILDQRQESAAVELSVVGSSGRHSVTTYTSLRLRPN